MTIRCYWPRPCFFAYVDSVGNRDAFGLVSEVWWKSLLLSLLRAYHGYQHSVDALRRRFVLTGDLSMSVLILLPFSNHSLNWATASGLGAFLVAPVLLWWLSSTSSGSPSVSIVDPINSLISSVLSNAVLGVGGSFYKSSQSHALDTCNWKGHSQTLTVVYACDLVWWQGGQFLHSSILFPVEYL